MSKPLVYILNGSGGCGKDTFVNMCRIFSNKSIIHISTITPIKRAAKLLGWNGEKDENSRKFLSDLKDLCTKTFDTSFRYIEAELYDAEENDVDYVFIDCREPEEIKRLVKHFGAQTIYIDASKRVKQITSNHADKNVQNYEYDLYIDNNGNYENLMKQAENFIKGGNQ